MKNSRRRQEKFLINIINNNKTRNAYYGKEIARLLYKLLFLIFSMMLIKYSHITMISDSIILMAFVERTHIRETSLSPRFGKDFRLA